MSDSAWIEVSVAFSAIMILLGYMIKVVLFKIPLSSMLDNVPLSLVRSDLSYFLFFKLNVLCKTSKTTGESMVRQMASDKVSCVLFQVGDRV